MVELFTFAQNRRLSPAEIERGVDALVKVRGLEEARPRFVADRQLDPKFCLPDGGGWTESGGATGLHRRAGRCFLEHPPALNRLRPLSMYFTGFSVHHQRRCDDLTSEQLEEPFLQAAPDFVEEPREGGVVHQTDYAAGWKYVAQRTPPSELFMPPPICGETGVNVSGIIVSHDTLVYQERVTLLSLLGLVRFLYEKIAERGMARVLEIGGGFGALACHIKQIHRNVSYTICDLPESLYFSAPYLALALPDLATDFVIEDPSSLDRLDAMHFMPNYAKNARFDLVINTLSMSELSEHQVRSYGALICRMIGETGLFFEQNHDNTRLGWINCKDYLPEYFRHRTPLRTPPLRVTQGPVDI